jgi:predicted amidohydrolase
MKSSLTIAAVQMIFHPTIDQNVAWITDTIGRTAESAGADVILFPECAVTGYNRDFSTLRPREIDGALARIAEAARRSCCNVLVGCPTFAGRKRLNSLLIFDRRGREVFRYSKIHLTPRDARVFTPGNKLALFQLDGVPCTAIICHERRYPELVRLPVMLGARIVFHPNAGLDALEVSKTKRRGRDGVVARAFENQIYYAFANSVGPQGGGLWSAGDSKIVAPDGRVLALADNRRQGVIHAKIDLGLAGRKYAIEALRQPAFLRPHWKAILGACRRQLK